MVDPREPRRERIRICPDCERRVAPFSDNHHAHGGRLCPGVPETVEFVEASALTERDAEIERLTLDLARCQEGYQLQYEAEGYQLQYEALGVYQARLARAELIEKAARDALASLLALGEMADAAIRSVLTEVTSSE